MKNRLPQLVVSGYTLMIFAALLWYIGSIILLQKGVSMLFEAEALKPEEGWPWQVAILGIFIGSMKAKFIFNKSCQKNLNRIATLVEPKIWQFFRIRFFAFLALMVLVGVTLSMLAHNNYPMLISVALLDISIAVALLVSSHVFWKQK
ncbi:MAG: hypothetical protein GWP19_01735 [Planctomycetia bacterium]|nr:hypothetical protein [Planctomycetia bacterium]